jgi:hypothetical protein
MTQGHFRALRAVSTIGYTGAVKTLRSGAAAGLFLLLAGCGNQESLGVSALSVVSAGVVNDPANKSLRFDLLKFGLERFCIEMQRRGARSS